MLRSMKKLRAAVHWMLGVFLVLGLLVCVFGALHDRKGTRRGSILIVPRPF